MLTNLRSERFSPVFSSRSFIVLSCTYRPMIHFEGWLFWVYTVRYWLKFVFSAYGCSIVVAVGKKKKCRANSPESCVCLDGWGQWFQGPEVRGQDLF